MLQDADREDHEDVTIVRKVYHVRCDAALLNFRPKLATFPSLVDPNDYAFAFTQQAGTRTHQDDGHPGLISCSARCDSDVYTIFNARVLSNPRQMYFLTYRITSGTVVIERQPGEILLQIA